MTKKLLQEQIPSWDMSQRIPAYIEEADPAERSVIIGSAEKPPPHWYSKAYIL